MPASTKVGLDALLTPENCVLLLIDVADTSKIYRQTYAGVLLAENGKIKLLRESLDTLAASKAFSRD